MFNIAGYLDKFKKLGDKKEKVRSIVADILKKETGVYIDQKSVVIVSGEVRISAPPPTHAVIFMKRERVIAALKIALPNISIDRIRCR